MALLPRRTALVAVLTVGAAAAFQPVLIGQAFGASAPSAPTGLTPNSSSTPHKDPVLAWGDVSGATGYQVELSKSDDFSDSTENVTLPDGGTTTTASYAVPQTLVHGVYFWRVRAEGTKADGAWSADAQLDKAWEAAPDTSGSLPSADASAPQNLNNPNAIDTYPWRFAWTPIQDASSYEIEFSTTEAFTPESAQDGKNVDGSTTVECLTDATSFTPYTYNQTSTPDIGVDNCDLSNLDTTGTDYWRVRGVDDSTVGPVKSASQKNDLECVGIPDSTAASGGAATGGALGTPTSTGQECSLWSAPGTIASPTLGSGSGSTPGPVTNVSLNCPSTGATSYACTTTPEFSWQTNNAQSYTVTVADDPDFTNIEHMYTTSYLSLTPRDELADYTAGKGYYVAIQACNNAGACGPATIDSFTKQSPTLTGLSATKVTGGFRLVWNDLLSRYAQTLGAPAVEAENYVVEVTKSTDPNFEDPTLRENVNAACDATEEGCYAPPSAAAVGKDQAVVSLTSSGKYLWRVLPQDLTGNVMPASNTPGTFSADLTPPTFRLAASGAAVSGPLTITSTEATVGATASTLHIVPVGSSTAVAGKLKAGTSGKTWTFTPSKPLVTGASYKLVVDPSVTDAAGNIAVVAGSAIRTTTKAKDSSKGWTYSSGWSSTSASSALSGSFRSAKAGKSAHVEVSGSVAKLYACKAPSMGTISVTVNGHTSTVSEHLSYTKCGVEIWHHALTSGTNTVTVKVSKTKGNIDEVAVS